MYFLLAVGVVACALSVVFIKASHAAPVWLAGIRLLIAAAALSPVYVYEARRHPVSWRSVGAAWPGAVVLSAHFVTWAMGARMTDAANGSLIVNLAPVVMPLIMFAMNGERVNRGEVVGTVVAMGGVAWLVGSHYSLDPKNAGGDAVCFGSMVLFCVYLALGRRRGMANRLWLYLVPLYAMAGVLCVGVAVATRTPLPAFTGTEIAMLACLGIVPTVIGHSILNWCIRHLRGQTVSVANLGQFVVAGVVAFLQFGEKPAGYFYAAGALVVAGAAVVIRSNRTSVDVDAES